MMKRMRTGVSTVRGVVGLLALLGGSCGGDKAPETLVEEAVDSKDLTASESALVSMGSDGSEATTVPEEAAKGTVQHLGARLQPAGCAVVTQNGPVVDYQLTNCSGPYGLLHLTGHLVATFTAVASGVAMNLTGTSVSVNGATLNIDAHVTQVVEGTKRTLTVTTKGTGTGPRGYELGRDGSYVTVWDSATTCRTLDGTWSLDIGQATRSTTIAGLKKCDGQCPAPGGTLIHRGLLGRTVTVVFSGGAVASWTSSYGRSGSVNLSCTP